jgi:hypothetical protein
MSMVRIVLGIGGLAIPFSCVAQTVDTLRVSDKASPSNTSSCAFLSHALKSSDPTKPPPVIDSVIVRIVDDSSLSKTSHATMPLQLRLNGLAEKSIAMNDTGAFYTSVASQQVTKTFELDSADKPVCAKFSLNAKDTTGQNGNSFVLLSLIKSVAGQIPVDEFFDIRVKLQGAPWLYTFGSLDVSLSTTQDTSAADSNARKLTDATFSQNFIVLPARNLAAPDREGALTLMYKVFDTRSFLGAGFTALELRHSRLEGSMITIAYVYRMYASTEPTGTPQAGTAIRDRNYAYFEYYIRVPGAQFLDRLRVKGGLLLPFSGPEAPTYRVTLSVPILDLTRF